MINLKENGLNHLQDYKSTTKHSMSTKSSLFMSMVKIFLKVYLFFKIGFKSCKKTLNIFK